MGRDFELIKKLRKELNDLLEERPEMRAFQEEIERRIKGQKFKNKIAIIEQMALERRDKLIKTLGELQNRVHELDAAFQHAKAVQEKKDEEE